MLHHLAELFGILTCRLKKKAGNRKYFLHQTSQKKGNWGMKNFISCSRFWAQLGWVAILVFCVHPSAMAQTTAAVDAPLTIYVVRHAEKDTVDKVNPALSALGEQRAKDLCQAFGKEMPQKVFSTNTRRTLQTAACLEHIPQLYDPRQLPALVKNVQAMDNTTTILVIGHSNTVLETIEAFGAKRPLAQLDDADYDYLFVLRKDKGQWTVEVKQYGAAHRALAGQSKTMQ
jgi:2,3-bisphosphoglycerate-dependent phosphoglycerate mutase